ncbi:MAG: hypothetical protein LBQ16_02520 [Gracilibacteraceae bacterium]|nr:hypothetical protein [Gracilibacteraceae bacterium]
MAKKKYEIRRGCAHGFLIIEEEALHDVVKRFWHRVKGIVLREVLFTDTEKGLFIEITLRTKEKPAPGLIREKNAAIRKAVETCCCVDVDDICIRMQETKRA